VIPNSVEDVLYAVKTANYKHAKTYICKILAQQDSEIANARG